MSRLQLNHLAWSKAEPARRRFNLAESAVAAPDLDALGMPNSAPLPRAGYAVLPDLERALGERLGAPGGRVLVTAGASEANAIAFAALLSPGDEVLVESPGYEPHRAVPALFGARVRTFVRDAASTGGMAAAVAAALGPATRLVVLSDLHNPTGAALSSAECEALESLAERHRLWLLCDETFRDAGERPLGTVAARGPRWVAVSTLTKAYGLGPLRLGWIAGGGDALERCADAQNALSVQPALPSVALTLALLPHLDRLRERTHRLLAGNHARWSQFLSRGPALRAVGPTSGTTAWCLFDGSTGGDAFAAFAAERFDLAVTPGRFFGDPGGVRVGLGEEPDPFNAALEIFEQAVAAFRFAGATA